ncbi:MAG: putative Ig domain-containing protein [Acidobacteria bacterium]|nr:putative Ig domain-containing protein [Acidobacteriota bacterium]
MFELRKLVCAAIGIHFVTLAYGAAPQVSTVPANALDRSQAHVTYSSRSITLKGASSAQGRHIKATWDFGDRSQPVSFSLEQGYDAGVQHTYFGTAGTEFTAMLTVEDTTTGESSSAVYRVVLREKSLAVEYAVAIDEALWYLHKAMRRDPANVTSWNLLAMESQGFVASGDSSNPYTETVAGALAQLMSMPAGSRDDAFYEAMARSGSPDAGALLARSGSNVRSARKRLGLTNKEDLASRLRALAAAGTGRPDAEWMRLEAQLRDQNNFDLPVATLYELSEALRNHATNGEPSPLKTIESETMGAIDWFSAEASLGASTDGVARVALSRQRADGSFPNDPDSTAKVILMGAVPPGNSVTNVTSQLTITTSPYVYYRANATYRTNLTITNNTGSVIVGPFTAGILNLAVGATFVNGNGTFNGWPYINIPGAANLAPGGSAVVQLQFTVLPGVLITFNKVIYAGTFPPSALAVGCPASTGTDGVAYSSSLVGSGGSLAYTYSIGPGSLPSPLILNPATGAITGTPTGTGTANFTANISDSAATVPQTASTPCTITISAVSQPDLTIAKSHTGNFTQGSSGNTYSVVVTNSGAGDKTAGQAVSVTDAPPTGLTVTGMTGSGWTCTTLPTCTRNDLLAAAGSYPAITVTVTVASNATSPQVNSISVTTAQSESNSGNNTATDSTTIVQPDLTITKTHTGDFAQSSTGNEYTVTVSNTGAGDKLSGQAVSVTDAPPTGLTVTAMSGAGWTCTTLPTCTRSDALAAAASYPAITVTVSVAANATSPQVNSISVTTAQSESNAANNTATDSTNITVAGQPDLTITKTHTGNFTQGSTGNNYTVVVTNSGAGDKTAGQSVSVTDAPPTGLTVTAMSGPGWTCTTLPTCTRTDLLAAAGSYPALTVTVSVASNATSPQVNSISVTTAQSESNAANNTATDSTTIVQPDLTITKTHSGNFVQGSTGNDYTVTVTNSGTGSKLAGQAVSVTDAPPTGLTVTAMNGTGWTCTTLPTCTRSDALAAAASYPAITVTVSVAANAASPQVNSISVTTAQSESNAANNTATDSTVITLAAQPDLTITKSHTGNFTQGSTGNTYTVVVTNSGAGDKTAGQSVSVTDGPPSGLTVTGMSGSGWTCTTLPTCTRTDLLAAAGSYPAITVTVSVASNATSPQVNSITVTTAQTESNAANNTATDSTTIVQPDLTITKTHTGTFTQGSTGNTYTVTVTNSGAGIKLAGQSVSVTDTPPSGLTVTAMNGTGWTCTTLPTCTRSDVLAPAASYPALTVTVSVAANATSPQVNSISVTTAQSESNAANNTATDSTTIVQPDLTITKSHSGNFLQGSAGNNYTVTVTNSGAGAKNAGQSVSVTDAPPAGLTVTAMSGTGWTCTTLPTCTRSDVLAPAASYPDLTVTVTVAANATSPKVNSISVTTAQTESNAANNTDTDSTIIEAPPTITSANGVTFRPGLAGQSFTVTTTGLPTGPSMVITDGGGFPLSVALTNNNNGTATIAGTPAALTQNGGPTNNGIYPIVITANNGIPPNATQNLTLTIACPAWSISSGPAAINGVFGVAISTATYGQTGNAGVITWSATGLPTNLSINSGTGAVNGTPNVTGTFPVTITATDGGLCTVTKAVTVSIGPNLVTQAYTGVGNTQFFIAGVASAPTTPAVSSANGLLVGASPAFSASLTTGTQLTGASCTGGVISNTDTAGRFIFTPNVSATSAMCTYTGASNTGPGSSGPASTTANLSFTLNNKVWYVRHGAAGGDGRSHLPVSDFGAGANLLNCTATTGTGDFIYVHQGSGNTTGACALKTNQSLIGAGATLSVGGGILTVAGNAANTPTIAGTLSAASANGLTVNGVSMNTGTSTAVDIQGSTGSTFTFRSISASGGGRGIVLTNTTGSFTVTGDGSNTSVGGNSSGGTISGMTGGDVGGGSQSVPFNGVGIYLNNVQNISLSRMTLNGTNQNYAIRGFAVNGFTLQYSTVGGTNGTATSLSAPENYGEGSIFFGNSTATGVSGGGTFTNNNITGGAARNLSIVNTAASTTTLTVTGNTFGTMQNLSGGNQSFAVEARVADNVIINSTVTGNTFTNAVSDLANFTGQDNTNMDVAFRNNVLSNNSAGNIIGGGSLVLATKGVMTFHVTGNTMRDAHGSAVTLFKAAPSRGVPSMNGFFDSNSIGVAGVVDSGSKSGNGIFVSAGGIGTMSFTISNNQIHQIKGNAHIYADNTGGSYTANFTITGNTFDTPGTGWFTGIAITNGSPASADTVNVCADIGGAGALVNTFNFVNNPNSALFMYNAGAAAGHTFRFPGANVSSTANIEAFVNGRNIFIGNTVTTHVEIQPNATLAGFSNTGTSCPTPAS